MIACAYPESVSARLSRVGALAARQVHQVNPAGDAVLVLLPLHQLSLFQLKQDAKIQESEQKHGEDDYGASNSSTV